MVGYLVQFAHMPTIKVTFVQATFLQATFVLATYVHIMIISAVTDLILTKLFGHNFLGLFIVVEYKNFEPNTFLEEKKYFGPKFFGPNYF